VLFHRWKIWKTLQLQCKHNIQWRLLDYDYIRHNWTCFSTKIWAYLATIILLLNPRSNPLALTSINKIGCNKSTWHQSTRSTRVKKSYLSIHKIVVEMTKKGRNLLTKSIVHIHTNKLLMEENGAHMQKPLFEKQLKYFKTWNKDINWNQ
jgi:hypothetical protein